MIRYTTPTHLHRVKGIDLTGFDVWVSYEQGMASLDVKASKVELDGEDTLIYVSFDQGQTARFREGRASVQINWVDQRGQRDATTVKEIPVGPNLLGRTVAHGS